MDGVGFPNKQDERVDKGTLLFCFRKIKQIKNLIAIFYAKNAIISQSVNKTIENAGRNPLVRL